jgi:hypothetical protein
MQVLQHYLPRTAAHSPGNGGLKGAIPITIGDARAAIGRQQKIRYAIPIDIAKLRSALRFHDLTANIVPAPPTPPAVVGP